MSKPVDVREVVALIAPFNRDLYTLEDDQEDQQEDKKKQPLIAFTSKAAVLDDYIVDQDEKKDAKKPRRGAKTFCKLAPIIPDILLLHDRIHQEAKLLYNKKTGGKGGRLDFVDYRDPKKRLKPHTFYFSGDTGPDKLADGASTRF